MIRKVLLASALGVALLIPGPAEARADVDITINLGYGGFFGRNITCGTGKRIVDRRFNSVRIYDCRGSTYVYTGRRNGKWYWIMVDSRRGVIKEVRRWRR